VLVIMELFQPVFHVTVARPLADDQPPSADAPRTRTDTIDER
jgi:hypothetical protein